MINKSRFVAVIMTGILMAQAAVPSMVYAEENTAELNGVTENLGVDEISETNEGELNEEMPETEEIDTESDEIEFAFGSSLRDITDEKTVLGLVYLTEVYEVKSEADLESDTLKEVETGQTVQILDAAISPEGAVWYQVGFYMEDEYFEGYIEREFLVSSDEQLLAWERENLPESEEELVRAADGRDIEAFPNSYRSALSAIKSRHPNWTFVKMNTGLDWNTVIKNEMSDRERNVIETPCPESWRDGQYNGRWYYASEGILKYYMDPRNFLTDETVFQFEQLTYNASYHTREAVQSILNSTFMKGQLPDSDKTYAQAFYEIGSALRVSPFHLACRVYQEQGKGTSPLISGDYPGYEGFYNYFNIGASGNTQEKEIKSGLERAKKEGWNTRYKSLQGGAGVISKSYILQGQDTLYLQKFDVDDSYNGLYWHQYMQNVQAAYSESGKIRQAYIQTGAIDNPFVFKIPVYNNMPENACGKPSDTAPTPAPVPTPSLFPFTDVAVNPGNWKYESVKFVYEKGIMAGMTANTFAPDGTLTRGMFAAVLYRMSGSPQVVYEDRFVDVPAGKWYSDAVVWASKNGIVRGFDDSHFAPDSNITREQMARMLRIYAQIRGCDNGQSADISGFADAGSVSGWAASDVRWAVGAGVISGTSSGGNQYLNPKGEATRAECASMLRQFIQKYLS